jgi:hypothetical protein
VTTPREQREVHDAIGGLLADGEIAIAWTLTIDVAGPDSMRYLAHRAGGGIDGGDAPMMWTALGMLRASAQVAEAQLAEGTVDAEDDEAG